MKRKAIVVSILLRKKRIKEIKERNEHNSDSSSIGDIAFLLLIFFIVTSSFILRQGISLSLPSKNSAPMKVKENMVFEVIPTEKGFIIDGEFNDRESFKNKLVEEFKKSKDIILLVKMNKGIRYDRLIDALSVAKETGLRNKISVKNL